MSLPKWKETRQHRAATVRERTGSLLEAWVRSLTVAALCCVAPLLSAAELDFSKAVIVAPANLSTREKKAVTMLVEEVERRSQIRWATVASAASGPAIVVERSTSGGPAEGYRIRTEAVKVIITGN